MVKVMFKYRVKSMSFAQLSVIVSVIVWSFSFTAQATSLKMATRAGKIFSLDVQGDRVTTKTSEFVVCGDHVDLVKKMKLWMNEHNHGSTPVLMGPVSDGCRSISKVNFTIKY